MTWSTILDWYVWEGLIDERIDTIDERIDMNLEGIFNLDYLNTEHNSLVVWNHFRLVLYGSYRTYVLVVSEALKSHGISGFSGHVIELGN